MKIVLVGASGFVGQNVVQKLALAGHSCDVLTRDAGRRSELKMVPGARLVQTDVYDQAALNAAFAGADVAVSMAGILNERGFGGSGFRRVHVDLVAGIIEACQQAGVQRLLHVSAINAGEGESHYLKTKGEAEQLLRDCPLDVTIFRPSVIFGPGDSFFNRFAELLRLAPVLPLACPKSRLQPVFVGDVAEAMLYAVNHPGTVGEVYELAGPRSYSLLELVQWTADTIGVNTPVKGIPDALARVQAKVMDFVPGKPFSTDNYLSLQLDNISNRDDLAGLGISASSIESIVPDYLGASPRQKRLAELRRKRSD
jgi:NADH dehydrogenase